MPSSKPASPPRGTPRSADTRVPNAIETKLKAICEAALGVKRINPNDNLFELGASSLRLIEIHERIDQEYPGQIDLTEMFDFPTISALTRHLQSKVAAVA